MKYKIIYQKGGSNPPPIRTLEDYIAENFPGQLDLIRSPVQIRNNVDFQASEFSGSSIGDIVNAVDNIITARQTARLTPTPPTTPTLRPPSRPPLESNDMRTRRENLRTSTTIIPTSSTSQSRLPTSSPSSNPTNDEIREYLVNNIRFMRIINSYGSNSMFYINEDREFQANFDIPTGRLRLIIDEIIATTQAGQNLRTNTTSSTSQSRLPSMFEPGGQNILNATENLTSTAPTPTATRFPTNREIREYLVNNPVLGDLIRRLKLNAVYSILNNNDFQQATDSEDVPIEISRLRTIISEILRDPGTINQKIKNLLKTTPRFMSLMESMGVQAAGIINKDSYFQKQLGLTKPLPEYILTSIIKDIIDQKNIMRHTSYKRERHNEIKKIIEEKDSESTSSKTSNNYVIDDNNTIFNVSKNIIDLKIPDTVKIIGESAFYDTNLTKVIIPDSVEIIGDYAFLNSEKLESVIIGENVKIIGKNAFYKTNLTKVIIPESVEIIGDGAFMSSSLNSVEIGNKVKLIGKDAFSNTNLTKVIIPESVESIGAGAFMESNLNSVEIGNNVKDIGNFAFSYNNLTEVIIPNSVEIISYGAFMNNNLKSVEIGDNVKVIGEVAFIFNKIGEIFIPDSVKKIGENAFDVSIRTYNTYNILYEKLLDLKSNIDKEKKRIIINRNKIYDSIFNKKDKYEIFKRDINVTFRNEQGVDLGGLKRTFFTLLSEEIFRNFMREQDGFYLFKNFIRSKIEDIKFIISKNNTLIMLDKMISKKDAQIIKKNVKKFIDTNNLYLNELKDDLSKPIEELNNILKKQRIQGEKEEEEEEEEESKGEYADLYDKDISIGSNTSSSALNINVNEDIIKLDYIKFYVKKNIIDRETLMSNIYNNHFNLFYQENIDINKVIFNMFFNENKNIDDIFNYIISSSNSAKKNYLENYFFIGKLFAYSIIIKENINLKLHPLLLHMLINSTNHRIEIQETKTYKYLENNNRLEQLYYFKDILNKELNYMRKTNKMGTLDEINDIIIKHENYDKEEIKPKMEEFTTNSKIPKNYYFIADEKYLNFKNILFILDDEATYEESNIYCIHDNISLCEKIEDKNELIKLLIIDTIYKDKYDYNFEETEEFIKGFHSMIDPSFIQKMSTEKLNLLIEGIDKIDVEKFLENIKFFKYNDNESKVPLSEENISKIQNIIKNLAFQDETYLNEILFLLTARRSLPPTGFENFPHLEIRFLPYEMMPKKIYRNKEEITIGSYTCNTYTYVQFPDTFLVDDQNGTSESKLQLYLSKAMIRSYSDSLYTSAGGSYV